MELKLTTYVSLALRDGQLRGMAQIIVKFATTIDSHKALHKNKVKEGRWVEETLGGFGPGGKGSGNLGTAYFGV